MQSQKQHRVLFLCLGNICRSTMAEIVMNHVVKKRGSSSHWLIDSAGTGSWHSGDKPDKRTIKTCKKLLGNECPPITHRGRQIKDIDYTEFDLILGMDDSNISNAKSMAPKKYSANIKLLGTYDPKGEHIIDDPYYGGVDGFEYIFYQIQRCCEALYDELEGY